jgi:hypothetical protein
VAVASWAASIGGSSFRAITTLPFGSTRAEAAGAAVGLAAAGCWAAGAAVGAAGAGAAGAAVGLATAACVAGALVGAGGAVGVQARRRLAST